MIKNIFQIFAQTTYNATEKDYLSRNITINPGGKLLHHFLKFIKSDLCELYHFLQKQRK